MGDVKMHPMIVSVGLGRNLLPRPATNSAAGNSTNVLANDILPDNVGIGNFMISTLTIGSEANAIDLATKVKTSGFDVLLVLVTDEVTSKHQVFKFLTFLARTSIAAPEWAHDHVQDVLKEKMVYSFNDSIFIVLHRAKVHSCHFTKGSYRSRGKPSLEFGTLALHMDTNRQRMEAINVGIKDEYSGTADRSRMGRCDWLFWEEQLEVCRDTRHGCRSRRLDALLPRHLAQPSQQRKDHK